MYNGSVTGPHVFTKEKNVTKGPRPWVSWPQIGHKDNESPWVRTTFVINVIANEVLVMTGGFNHNRDKQSSNNNNKGRCNYSTYV